MLTSLKKISLKPPFLATVAPVHKLLLYYLFSTIYEVLIYMKLAG
jgi:hypothetical protein